MILKFHRRKRARKKPSSQRDSNPQFTDNEACALPLCYDRCSQLHFEPLLSSRMKLLGQDPARSKNIRLQKNNFEIPTAIISPLDRDQTSVLKKIFANEAVFKIRHLRYIDDTQETDIFDQVSFALQDSTVVLQRAMLGKSYLNFFDHYFDSNPGCWVRSKNAASGLQLELKLT